MTETIEDAWTELNTKGQLSRNGKQNVENLEAYIKDIYNSEMNKITEDYSDPKAATRPHGITDTLDKLRHKRDCILREIDNDRHNYQIESEKRYDYMNSSK